MMALALLVCGATSTNVLRCVLPRATSAVGPLESYQLMCGLGNCRPKVSCQMLSTAEARTCGAGAHSEHGTSAEPARARFQ